MDAEPTLQRTEDAGAVRLRAAGDWTAVHADALERLVAAGVPNLRDLGGIATASGHVIAPGRLWRSSHFGSVSDDELDALRAIGL